MIFHEWSFKPKDKNDNISRKLLISFHSIKYDNNCLYVWIGDSNCKMENLSTSIKTNYSSDPLSTEILQINSPEQVVTNPSSDLAIKLAKKLNKQVFVSLNVPFDAVEFDENDLSIQQMLEKCLFEEIKSRPEMF
jgi:hypothetical protein